MPILDVQVVVKGDGYWQAVLQGAAAGGFAILVWMMQSGVTHYVRRKRFRVHVLTLLNAQLDELDTWKELVAVHLRQIMPDGDDGRPLVGLTHHPGDQDDLKVALRSSYLLMKSDELRRLSRIIDAFGAIETLLWSFFEKTNAMVGAERDTARALRAQALVEGARLLKLYGSMPAPPVLNLMDVPEEYPRYYPSDLVQNPDSARDLFRDAFGNL